MLMVFRCDVGNANIRLAICVDLLFQLQHISPLCLSQVCTSWIEWWNMKRRIVFCCIEEQRTSAKTTKLQATQQLQCAPKTRRN